MGLIIPLFIKSIVSFHIFNIFYIIVFENIFMVPELIKIVLELQLKYQYSFLSIIKLILSIKMKHI